MKILGISALFHDSAASLVVDGKIVAAVQEERFTRKKHDPRLPINAIKYCIFEGLKIDSGKIDYVVFYENPMLTLDRYIKNILALGNESRDIIDFGYDRTFSKELWIDKLLQRAFPDEFSAAKFLVLKHHVSHAASAFFPSPFKKSVIITLDGVGEWTTLSIGIGDGNKLELKEELKYPHSLGLFYSAFTYFCGFKVNSGEYKFMGLAPYGKPIYCDIIKERVIDIKDDGSFRLNLDYFDYQNGRTMINEEKFSELFPGGRRAAESRIDKRDMDIAASVQKITEEIILKLASHAKQKYGMDIDNLVLAGGVALNCVANGKLLESGIFTNLWIQPASGDAGGALGSALYIWYQYLNNTRNVDGIHDLQEGSYLGIDFDDKTIKDFLDENRFVYHQAENPENLPDVVAKLLEDQKIIGICRGRMEYGPRALGSRSIIADPRSADMQSKMNLKIKFRESFRPFAPAVLAERISDYFDIDVESPYMLLCAPVKKDRQLPFDVDKFLADQEMDMLRVVKTARSDIPAVTHVDYSARIQSVNGKFNRFYYDVIKAFESRTGCGVIINTSFNVRGEPIVCTPKDAYVCFMRSDMDVLILGGFVLYKEEQPEFEDHDWRHEYELD